MKILVSESRHSNSQRDLYQLLTADIKQINRYEVNRGAVIGDHYHKETKEYFFIIKGTFMVRIGDNSFAANPGFLFLVEPGEKHTLEALTNKSSFMTFLSEPYNNDKPDLHK